MSITKSAMSENTGACHGEVGGVCPACVRRRRVCVCACVRLGVQAAKIAEYLIVKPKSHTKNEKLASVANTVVVTCPRAALWTLHGRAGGQAGGGDGAAGPAWPRGLGVGEGAQAFINDE